MLTRLAAGDADARPAPRVSRAALDARAMGAYLSQPVTRKESSDGSNGAYAYGTSSMQGWRTNMEVRRRMNECARADADADAMDDWISS